jgi:hypothetical protein
LTRERYFETRILEIFSEFEEPEHFGQHGRDGFIPPRVLTQFIRIYDLTGKG